MDPVRIPRRINLVEQVAEILRQDIREGKWPRQLPGEHDLSEQLQVSRSTLRMGLEILRREGVLQVSKGRRHALTSASRQAKRAPSKIIGLVLGLSIQNKSSTTRARNTAECGSLLT